MWSGFLTGIDTLSSMRPDRIDHLAPDLSVGRVGDQDVLELRIGRTESYAADVVAEAPDVEFPLHLDDADQPTVSGNQSAADEIEAEANVDDSSNSVADSLGNQSRESVEENRGLRV